ncbi:hypothetical protein LSPH24S_04736 [Lysinibacillus sphaericus]
MKGKLVFTIGLTGVLALTIGFAKDNIGKKLKNKQILLRL